jgi:hypothetical protein
MIDLKMDSLGNSLSFTKRFFVFSQKDERIVQSEIGIGL